MATRHLQRLRAEMAQSGGSRSDALDSGSSDEDDVTPVKQPAFNPFDLLDDDSGPQQLQEGSEEEDSRSGVDNAKVTPASPVETRTAIIKPKKRKSKAKKKAASNSERAEPSTAVADDTDIDAVLQELNIDPAAERSIASEAAATSSAPGASLFAVQPKSLQAEQELVDLFGSSVVALERRAEQEVARGARRRGRMGASRAPQRRLLLVPPKDDRRPYDGSLAMQSVGPATDGGHEFRYTPTSSYRTATMHFEQSQATYDPNNVVAVLQRHPFHVESLLAMYDLYQATGSDDYAEQMLEGALYGLDCAWHPHFKSHVMAGTARLPHSEGQNASFFQPAVRAMRTFAQRGCHRTALEWCKMLLSLDRDDPCGLIFHLDYFSLRSREYDLLFKLAEDDALPLPLHTLPSYSFSLCLAAFYQFQQQMHQGGLGGATATGVHARGDNLQLDAQLVNAVLTFPVVVVTLVAEMQEQGAAKDAAWTSVLQRRLFKCPHGQASATLVHLADIFTTRNVILWKAPNVLAWLLRCCQHGADCADGVDVEPYPDQLSPENARMLCEASYPDSPVNEYKFLNKDSYSDSAASLPPEQLAGMMAAEQGQPVVAAPRDGVALTAEQLRGANPIMMLLQTLLPWVNVADNAGGEGPADGGDAELRNIVQNVGNEVAQFLRDNGVDPEAEDLGEEDRERVAMLMNQYFEDMRGGERHDEA